MNLFSKTKPEEPTGLPEGYDDEASRYYVPADRREFYVATAKPAFSEVLDRADWLIRQEAAEQVDREDEERGESPVSNLTGRRRQRDPREYAERRQGRAEQIKRARHEEFVALAGHSLRSGAAESAAKTHEHQTAVRAVYVKDHLCFGCQTVQPSTQPRRIRRTGRAVCDDCEQLYSAELVSSCLCEVERRHARPHPRRPTER